jgi:hypothetical protein
MEKSLQVPSYCYFLRMPHSPTAAFCLPGRKAEGTTEPVFYHSGPYSLDEELVVGHAIGAINDLTPGVLV